MAWVYTVVLAACGAGILAVGVALTRRLFSDELLADDPIENVAAGARDDEGTGR